MKNTRRIGVVEVLCTVNLVALAYMLLSTSYLPGFNEQRAVVASFLWLFTLAPAIPAAIYGVVDANRRTKARRNSKNVRLVICWLTIAANAAVIASMFVRG